jgi:capsular exopolysaccharide synthesis family protein
MTSSGTARLVRVQAWWIVLVTLLVMGAAYAVASGAPREFRSAAIVVVESRVRENTTPVPPDMGTEKQLAQSGLVVDPAAGRLGVTADELAEGLVVSVAPDANVLTFAYTHADPRIAQARAGALAEAYVRHRNSGPDNGPAPAQQATLVTEAWLPGAPVERPLYLDLGLGLVIGLLLGVATAVLRDRLSDRLRGRADLAVLLGGPVLATVPAESRRGPDTGGPVLLRAPDAPAAEAFRYLRSRLQPLLGEHTTVLVTSADGPEGRSTTAANLAVALAQAGRSVILVDADLHHPGVAAAFGMPDGIGLTDVLAEPVHLAGALRDGPVPRLRVLTGGRRLAGAPDLLGSEHLRRLLRTLRGRCDVVVLDCAAVLTVSDAIVLAAVSDHIVFVGDLRRSTRRAVARGLAELAPEVPGGVLGVLLNGPRGSGRPTPRDAAGLPVPPVPPVVASPVVTPVAAPPVAATPVVTLPAVAPTSPAPAPSSTIYTSAAAESNHAGGQ